MLTKYILVSLLQLARLRCSSYKNHVDFGLLENTYALKYIGKHLQDSVLYCLPSLFMPMNINPKIYISRSHVRRVISL